MGRFEDWLSKPVTRPGNPARPLVTLSYAQSLDGSIALHRGQSLALSGPESMKRTHWLRAAHAAILVGIGTVLADDPQLNVRFAQGADPAVIVLDSHLRLPTKSALGKQAGRVRIFHTALATVESQTKLERAGFHVERQANNQSERVELKPMLARLLDLGFATLMVEGGGQVIRSFLAEGLVDRVVLTVSPIFVGGYKALNGDVNLGSPLPSIAELEVEKVGEDLVLWGDVA